MPVRERAILIFRPLQGEDALEEEMRNLAFSADLDVVQSIYQVQRGTQKRLGSGKIKEIQQWIEAEEADVVVFDEALSPALQREYEEAFGIKVVDRMVLILDIFARRASSREGKLQVELAQLSYLLPRLSGKGHVLSRQGGGIGTRGPGETQLETDRRHIRRRIHYLEEALKKVAVQRQEREKKRHQSAVQEIALVGYTNAGKSALCNALVGFGATESEDALFQTLDRTTHRCTLPSGRLTYVSDTVGFIRNLPTDLVKAFRSTLDALKDADLILHVVDGSDATAQEHIAVTDALIEQIAPDIPVLGVVNKSDRIDDMAPEVLFPPEYKKVLWISALQKKGLEQLIESIEAELRKQERLFIWKSMDAAQDGKLVAALYEETHVKHVSYKEDGVEVEFLAKEETAARLRHRFSIHRKGDVDE